MENGLTPEERAKVTRLPDRREAIRYALQIAKKGDIVLCAGKGHETYQEIKGVKYPFNDVEEFKKLFTRQD
jgi:UDP-N-acetylmuramoyl-L-alanyl-D-glutamate--2,6-diaminopimelate ligase